MGASVVFGRDWRTGFCRSIQVFARVTGDGAGAQFGGFVVGRRDGGVVFVLLDDDFLAGRYLDVISVCCRDGGGYELVSVFSSQIGY